MPAVLFGSLSTLADTSELQRDAFNQAFASHDLGWTWEQEEYRAMLGGNGGRDRIAAYARERGQEVDAAAVHATKSRIFQQSLAETALEPRPGVVETIRDARERGLRVGLVTTTSPENVAALLGSLSAHVRGEDLDLVLDSSGVSAPKPDRAAYVQALETLRLAPEEAVAIEDNPGGVAAATAAGVPCVAFPNQNTAGQDFADARATVDRVDLDALTGPLDA